MSTLGPSPSSSSRDLTLVVESASGTPEEYFAQVGLSIGRATSNTIHIDHPEVDHIHAKMVRDREGFSLQCEGAARLEVLEPEPGTFETVSLIPGLTISLGGILIRCKRQLKGMGSLSDDYWADAAGGERFRVESESFTGDLPKKVGPYEIRKFVARGGMGIVLQGIHEGTAQPAAVKLPTPDLNKDQEWLKRFEQEVQTLKSVTHPNLVRLQDAGKEGELHWMAMDWIEGFTVKEWLDEWVRVEQPVPLDQIQLFMKQMVEGLGSLHAQGIIHRDLKPANLLVDKETGVVHVADFGLAKQAGMEGETLLTRTGTFAGTMHYMAPEQSEGFDVTPATDVYALGVIWHELLASKRPGAGKFKLQKLRSDCPGPWVNLIEDCLEQDSCDRPSLNTIWEILQDKLISTLLKDASSEPLPQPGAEPALVEDGGLSYDRQPVAVAQKTGLEIGGITEEHGVDKHDNNRAYIIGFILIICFFLFGNKIARIFSGETNRGEKIAHVFSGETNRGEPYLKEGLVAYYPFNGNANDESGNANNGVPVSVSLNNDRHGKKDSAYSFEGPGGVISVAMPSDLAGEKPFTTSMWFNANSYKIDSWLLAFGQQATDKAFHIGLNVLSPKDGVEFGYWNWYQTQNGTLSSYLPPIKKWVHLTISWNDNTLLGYINGEKIHETNNIKRRPNLPENGKIFIGAINGFRSAFDGFIDDVRIYNRALSAEEVKALYEFEKAE